VVQVAVCGLFCLVVAGAAGDLEAPPDASVWWALVITAVFATALAYFVQSYAQRHAPPARTALILASEPAFAGLFGWLLAGDRLSAVAWTGAALIVAAIVTVEVLPRLRPPRPLPEG
jgi:drug/metabolite transporter (DMT)-like permease